MNIHQKKSRDVNRIEPFLGEIAKVWKRQPDMRFGQLITILEYRAKAKGIQDLFYLEEEGFLELLQEYAKEQEVS